MVPYDTSQFIDISIQEVLKTLAEALVLVVLVMYLFLENLRATLIPTIVIPVALVGALVGLYLLGYSINVLTLFAMVLAIGIVVDDAIVVVENVERIMTTEGLSPRDATRKAMDQIVGAIIAITLVLSAVFIPMAFFAGSTGAIYRQFAVTLVLTMMFSALMALTLTPALCATLLKHEPGKELMPTSGFFGWFNRFFARTTQGLCLVRSAASLKKTARYLLVYAVDHRRDGLAVHQAAGQLPAGRRPGLFHQRHPAAAGRHAGAHAGSAVARSSSTTSSCRRSSM